MSSSISKSDETFGQECVLTIEISIYTLSDLGYSSNLIGSLSRANAALFTRYRVDNALSHKTKQNGRRKLAFRLRFRIKNSENKRRQRARKHQEGNELWPKSF